MSKMEVKAFLQLRLPPICEELAASGARHVIVAAIPAAAHMKILSDLMPMERALELRRIADQLYVEAEKLEKGQASDGGIILPGLPGGANIIKPS